MARKGGILTAERKVKDSQSQKRKIKAERDGQQVGISDLIAEFLQSSLDTSENGVLEVQRSDLAQRFNCVPSQINYVMSTRFSPERGYIVESRRGGNGYIRITLSLDHKSRRQQRIV